jgi:broad specificity phosphatase PhoE
MDGKTLILIRHAHRDTKDRAADNGLSDKGRKQASVVAKYFERSTLFAAAQELMRGPSSSRPSLMSSPKHRCIETIEPLARKLNAEIGTSGLVIEQKGSESPREFGRRIEEFISWWKSEGPPLVIVCSHGDWLPACVERLTGGRVEFRKGAWAEIVLEDGGRPVLRWLIQSFAQSKPKK